MSRNAAVDPPWAEARLLFGSGFRIRCLQIFHLALTGQLFHATLTVGRSLIRIQIRPDFINTLADAAGAETLPDHLQAIPLRDGTTLDLTLVKAIYAVPLR